MSDTRFTSSHIQCIQDTKRLITRAQHLLQKAQQALEHQKYTCLQNRQSAPVQNELPSAHTPQHQQP